MKSDIPYMKCAINILPVFDQGKVLLWFVVTFSVDGVEFHSEDVRAFSQVNVLHKAIVQASKSGVKFPAQQYSVKITQL